MPWRVSCASIRRFSGLRLRTDRYRRRTAYLQVATRLTGSLQIPSAAISHHCHEIDGQIESITTTEDTSFMAPPHVNFATAELRLLQQILGLQPAERLISNLRDPVLVCLDVEAFEAAQDKITEIGVAVLDTLDLKGLHQGSNAENFLTKIETAHYRLVEHAKLLNRRYVKGCEDCFNFGTTAWINLADTRLILNRIFLDPSRLHQASDFEVDVTPAGRNVIFVAHGLRGDRNYLKHIGFSLNDINNIKRTFDTQVVAGSRKKQPIGLQRLLIELDLAPINLHNAGNDAVYTLQALILMAVRDHEIPGSVFLNLQQTPMKLPPAIRNEQRAPHIYAGSAVHSTGDSTNSAQSNTVFAGEVHERTSTSVLPLKRSIDETHDDTGRSKVGKAVFRFAQ